MRKNGKIGCQIFKGLGIRMKNKQWHQEVEHLETVVEHFDSKIQQEHQKAQSEDVDADRRAFFEHEAAKLEDMKQSPYFGRLDVEIDGEQETMYIGGSTVLDDADRVVVYDWRAPIASLFYEGTLGNLTYDTPSGKKVAHATLKRDIVIKQATLQSVYDVEDEESRLIEVLQSSSKRDGKLLNITSTIQKEQNELIRYRQKDWLIVKGCAGSGKTTILLQRIAYLMYQAHKEQMNDMLLLSRNQLFAHYISHVIPSLTGSELYQKTVTDMMKELFVRFYLHRKVKLIEPLTIGNQLRTYLPDAEWMVLVQRYVDQLSIQKVHFKDVIIRGSRLFSVKDFHRLKEQTNPQLSLQKQLSQIQAALEKNLKRRLAKFYVSQRAIEIYDELGRAQLEMYTHDKEFSSEAEYYQFIGENVFAKDVERVKEQIEMYAFIDVAKHVQGLLGEARNVRKETAHSVNATVPVKEVDGRYEITVEGLRLMLYMATVLTPVRAYNGYSYLFIDEVQDMPLLFLGAMSRYYFQTKFMAVGDDYQVFHSYPTVFSLKEDSTLQKTLFDSRALEYKELAISYRCTAQITRFANGILNWELEKNVFPRTGALPQLYEVSSHTAQEALEHVMSLEHEAVNTTGILCRTMKEATQLHQQLEIPLLEDGSEYMGSPFVVSTIDTAKGMEFDRVILVNVSTENYHTEQERAMLYTSCTRAKHLLQLLLPSGSESVFVKENKAEAVTVQL